MKVIALDMDGTLVDSEMMYIQIIVDILRKHHQFIDYSLLFDTIGVTFDTFYTMLGNSWNPKKSKEEIEELFNNEAWNEQFDWNDLLFPFVRYFLDTLSNQGFKFVIASSSPSHLIEDMVEQCEIQDYIDAIYTGQDCIHGKPDPEIYCKVIEDYHIDPHELIVIEDSPHGIQAGKAAGAYVIAHKEERFGYSQEKADYIADDFCEITNHIIERETL